MYYTLCLTGVFLLATSAGAQSDPTRSASLLSTPRWCADSGTLCWSSRPVLSGVRFVGEPTFGTVFQGGADQFEEEGFGRLAAVGVEFNLYKAISSVHVSYIPPGSITFDERSEVVRLGTLMREDRGADIEGGINLGLSFLDGSVFAGWGFVLMDKRDFTDTATREDYGERYFFINFQPVSAVRSLIKNLDRDDTETAPTAR